MNLKVIKNSQSNTKNCRKMKYILRHFVAGIFKSHISPVHLNESVFKHCEIHVSHQLTIYSVYMSVVKHLIY